MNAPFVFCFFPSSSLRVDHQHQQPLTATSDCSESHSLLLFCVAACLFVCARLRLKSLFVFLFFILLRRFLMPPLVYCRVRRRVTWRDVDA